LFDFSTSLITAFIFIGVGKYSTSRCSLQKTAVHSKCALGADSSNKDFYEEAGHKQQQGTPRLKPTHESC